MAARCTAEGVGRQQYLLRAVRTGIYLPPPADDAAPYHCYGRYRREGLATGPGPATSAGGLRRNPDSNGDVTIVLPVAQDCAGGGAICTGDGRKLSNRLEFTVSGP